MTSRRASPESLGTLNNGSGTDRAGAIRRQPRRNPFCSEALTAISRWLRVPGGMPFKICMHEDLVAPRGPSASSCSPTSPIARINLGFLCQAASRLVNTKEKFTVYDESRTSGSTYQASCNHSQFTLGRVGQRCQPRKELKTRNPMPNTKIFPP